MCSFPPQMSKFFLCLNVGGRTFSTTKSTLEKCVLLYACVAETADQDVLFDRDPDVFARMLKVLRGYPGAINSALKDADVLHELQHWEHEFACQALPKWMEEGSEYSFEAVKSSIHTLDCSQSAQYGQTHKLVIGSVVKQMIEMGALLKEEEYPICQVVGAKKNWIERCWVETKTLQMAKVRVRYMNYFAANLKK